MTITRIEKDSLGELEVPASALYGAQTQRAINNFTISGHPLPLPFISGLLTIKKSAAKANQRLGTIPTDIAEAIQAAVDDLLQRDDIMQHFPVDIFQTGSGTSSNMNANEVIATLASQIVGKTVNANDHVNFGQSSNDVIPSAIHVSAALLVERQLLPALTHLQTTIEKKAANLTAVIKTGRTHLMDAMPITMAQSLLSWAEQIRRNREHLQLLQAAIQTLALGGTAVGTGINTHPDFAVEVCRLLSEETGIHFTPAGNFFASISSQDTAASLSGQLKTLAISLIKIANDLRWMNSGPLSGLGEIQLEALQPGSSIMPGKINPVIPEAVSQVAAQVIGFDAAITVGAQSGNFELNVMLPMIAWNLINSIDWLSRASHSLADQAIKTFTVNQEHLQATLYRNPILVTALNPIIGYAKAADIAKQAYKEKRPIIDVALEHTSISREELEQLLDPAVLIKGGLQG